MKAALATPLTIALLAATPILAAQQAPENYCASKADWQAWDEILQKNPGDDEIAGLYALRLGLCTMIDQGKIENQRAIQLFNRAHDSLVEKPGTWNSSAKTAKCSGMGTQKITQK